MNPREQELLQIIAGLARRHEWQAGLGPCVCEWHLKARAALADHAAPQETPERPSDMLGTAPAGAAPASVSPQAPSGKAPDSLIRKPETPTDATLPTAAGADWVPVPREPTKAMLDVGYAAACFPRDPEICVAMWKAMLSAAPRPDAGEELAKEITEYCENFSPAMSDTAVYVLLRKAARALGRGEGKP